MLPNTLAKKFIVILSSIMLLAFSITGYITYRLHLNISEKEVAQQFVQRIEQVAARVDLRLQDVYRWSDRIVINPIIVQSLEKTNNGEPLSYTEQTELRKLLNSMMLGVPGLIAFYISDLQGNYYMPGNTLLVNDLGQIARAQVNEVLQGSDGELVWIKGEFTKNETGILSNKGTEMILASRWLKDMDMNNYGALILVLNQHILSNDLNTVFKDGEGEIYLFDEYSLIYSNEKDMNQIDMDLLRSIGTEGMRQINGNSYLFAQSNTMLTNFKLVGRISMQTLQEKSRLLMTATFVSALISVLLAMILVIFASGKLLQPLKKLVQAMRKVREGKLETRVDIGTKDELAYIGESFNSMVENVGVLIKEVYIKQLHEREAELTALHAQLNPHFLYNTLNMIHGKVYLQNDKITAELIVSFSELLRYSLDPASSETKLANELEQIDNYLTLQKERYKYDVEVIMDVDKEVLQCGILRLLLQPLVDNVFVHAFRDDRKVNVLFLKAFQMEELLVIEILDNGCGMTRDALRKAGLHLKGVSDTKENRGISKIARRIALYYGEPYGLEIESTPKEGTLVRVRLPYRMLENRIEVDNDYV